MNGRAVTISIYIRYVVLFAAHSSRLIPSGEPGMIFTVHFMGQLSLTEYFAVCDKTTVT